MDRHHQPDQDQKTDIKQQQWEIRQRVQLHELTIRNLPTAPEQ